jgi:hypothetical protein
MMPENTSIRRALGMTNAEWRATNRAFPTSTLEIQHSTFLRLRFHAKNKKAEAKLNEHSNTDFYSGRDSRVFAFHLN